MKDKKAIVCVILAASFYAISSPLSKLLLNKIPAIMMAALLYLGAGIGLMFIDLVNRTRKKSFKVNSLSYNKRIRLDEKPLTCKEMPYVTAMVALDILAPILMMLGLNMTTAANVSLLNNFEVVATSLIAFLIFKESISKRLWFGIGLVTLASFLLSVEDMSSFSFSYGSIFVLLACIVWGMENNCTRKLSSKKPIHIVMIKGFGSGMGALVIAFLLGETTNDFCYILFALLLGFIAYGLSIVFYIYAQRDLGAAKTSAYYAISPFIASVISLLIFQVIPNFMFVISLGIMAVGTYFVTNNDSKGEVR